MSIGVCHFFAKRLEEAKTMLLRSLQVESGWAQTYRFLAACGAHMGQLDEAHKVIDRLRCTMLRPLMPSRDIQRTWLSCLSQTSRATRSETAALIGTPPATYRRMRRRGTISILPP